MVRTWHFPCHGPRFNPWLGNENPTSLTEQPKKKKKKRTKNISSNKHMKPVNSVTGSFMSFKENIW